MELTGNTISNKNILHGMYEKQMRYAKEEINEFKDIVIEIIQNKPKSKGEMNKQ